MAKYYNESIETASRDKLAAIQSERLVKTVKRVYDNVPAYRKKMDDIGLKPEDIKSVDDLSKLPFTYKQDLRDNYPYGLFACPLRDVVRIHASSGTTGKQTVLGYTENDLDMWAECAARAIVAAGGVAANSVIRADLERACEKAGCRLYLPPLRWCGDNGAMIGAQGYYEYLAGHTAGMDLNAYATRDISE